MGVKLEERGKGGGQGDGEGFGGDACRKGEGGEKVSLSFPDLNLAGRREVEGWEADLPYRPRDDERLREWLDLNVHLAFELL